MERLTGDPAATERIVKARDLALKGGSIACEPIHLLRVLADERDGAAAMLFRGQGVDPVLVRASLVKTSAGRSRGSADPWHPRADADSVRVSQSMKGVLDDAIKFALEGLSSEVSLRHLVSAVVRTSDPVVRNILDGESGAARAERAGPANYRRAHSLGSTSKASRLLPHGRLLTVDAAEGRLDPVIGRDNELRRLTYILGRRRKNNPVLIGAPGVGKTAIAEGLAQRIVDGAVPRSLLGKDVFALNIGSLVAGTKYRGEFEERIQDLLDAIAGRSDSILVFIDELHTIAGAGGAEGAIDAASFFKPLLARGELRVIGATTLEEYRRHILRDGALERRFQPVIIAEPSADVALEMLRGLRETYVGFHGVDISDEALAAAVALSEKYIIGRHLPDKAIDLVDEAASRRRAGFDQVCGGSGQPASDDDTGPTPVVEAADVEDVARDWAGADLGVDWQEGVYQGLT